MPTLLTPIGKREGGVRCTYSQGMIDREEDWHFLVDSGRNLDGSPLNISRADVLFNTPGLPIIGVTILDGMLCIGGDATRKDENASIWDVNLTFSTSIDQDDPNNGQQQGDPTLWVPVRQTMWELKEEFSQTDVNNNPVLNTAGMPFSTGTVKRRYLPAWEFTQFESISVTDNDVLGRMSVVNSASWPPSNPKPAKTWLCKVLESVVGFYMGYRCRMTKYRIVHDPQKWTQKRPSVGPKYLSGGKLYPYLIRGTEVEGKLTSSGDRVTDEEGATISGRTLAIVEVDDFAAVPFTFLRIT